MYWDQFRLLSGRDHFPCVNTFVPDGGQELATKFQVDLKGFHKQTVRTSCFPFFAVVMFVFLSLSKSGSVRNRLIGGLHALVAGISIFAVNSDGISGRLGEWVIQCDTGLPAVLMRTDTVRPTSLGFVSASFCRKASVFVRLASRSSLLIVASSSSYPVSSCGLPLAISFRFCFLLSTAIRSRPWVYPVRFLLALTELVNCHGHRSVSLTFLYTVLSVSWSLVYLTHSMSSGRFLS